MARAARAAVRSKRQLGPVRLIIVTVFSLVAVIAAGWTVHASLAQQDQPTDMRGNPVVFPAPSPEMLARIDAVPSEGGMRLNVPAAALDVPVGAINQVDGVMDPPGFASAYLVRNYGANLAHATVGTVFVVMHSCRGGAVCPGNYLIDIAAGTASVPQGTDVYLGDLHYRVTGWQKVDKPQVGATAEIWENVPGRLVLLTCLQNRTQTASTQNMIITAQLVGGDEPGSA
jgi:hypothetical protein